MELLEVRGYSVFTDFLAAPKVQHLIKGECSRCACLAFTLSERENDRY